MSNDRLIGVDIDDETLGASGPDAEHERRVAIFDLLESNVFKVLEKDEGPYQLNPPRPSAGWSSPSAMKRARTSILSSCRSDRSEA